MPDYIADSEGRIDVPGITATYPPGTIVTYVNGSYAGHVSPVLEEVTPLQGGSVVNTPAFASSIGNPLVSSANVTGTTAFIPETPLQGVGSETPTQPIPAIQEPLEHPPVENV